MSCFRNHSSLEPGRPFRSNSPFRCPRRRPTAARGFHFRYSNCDKRNAQLKSTSSLQWTDHPSSSTTCGGKQRRHGTRRTEEVAFDKVFIYTAPSLISLRVRFGFSSTSCKFGGTRPSASGQCVCATTRAGFCYGERDHHVSACLWYTQHAVFLAVRGRPRTWRGHHECDGRRHAGHKFSSQTRMLCG